MSQDTTQAKKIDRSGDGLSITWGDGATCLYSGPYLRQRCPCAVCRPTPGHPSPEPIPPGPVSVKSAQAMGWYALQLIFSDGHETGIYSFEYLREICPKS